MEPFEIVQGREKRSWSIHRNHRSLGYPVLIPEGPPCPFLGQTGGQGATFLKSLFLNLAPSYNLLTEILDAYGMPSLKISSCNPHQVQGLLRVFSRIDVVTLLFDSSFWNRYLRSALFVLNSLVGRFRWPNSPMEECFDFQEWFCRFRSEVNMGARMKLLQN